MYLRLDNFYFSVKVTEILKYILLFGQGCGTDYEVLGNY